MRRFAIALTAAAALFTVHAGSANAATGCGYLQCDVQVTAASPSLVDVKDGGVPIDSPTISQDFHFERMRVAVIGPGLTDADKLIVRCVNYVCGELKIATHRIAGNAVEVRLTVNLIDGFGTWYDHIAASRSYGPITIPSGGSGAINFSVFHTLLLSSTDTVIGTLTLANKLVPHSG